MSDRIVNGVNVTKAEAHYGGARYIGYYDLPNREGPFLVFYQPNPKFELGHSHWFGLFRDYEPRSGESLGLYIMNAEKIAEAEFSAIEMKDGSFLVSRYRHDFQNRDGAMIDGGLAGYIRYNPAFPPTHKMKVTPEGEVFTPFKPKV